MVKILLSILFVNVCMITNVLNCNYVIKDKEYNILYNGKEPDNFVDARIVDFGITDDLNNSITLFIE